MGEIFYVGKGDGGGRRQRTPLEAAEDLIMKSSRLWIEPGRVAYRDDISLVVAGVKV